MQILEQSKWNAYSVPLAVPGGQRPPALPPSTPSGSPAQGTWTHMHTVHIGVNLAGPGLEGSGSDL